MKRTSWSAGLKVSGGGTGVVAHAGSAGLRLLADRTGLTDAMSAALARRSFAPRHDRGQVVTDLAVMIADGGEAISDIDVLRHQSPLLGPVASAPTVWRTLNELTPGRLAQIDKARARGSPARVVTVACRAQCGPMEGGETYRLAGSVSSGSVRRGKLEMLLQVSNILAEVAFLQVRQAESFQHQKPDAVREPVGSVDKSVDDADAGAFPGSVRIGHTVVTPGRLEP